MQKKRTHLLETIRKHTDDGVLVLEMNGVILSANQEAVQILGFSEEQLIGQSYSWIFFHETENHPLSQLINDGLKRHIEYQVEEISYKRPDGETVSLAVSTSVLSHHEALSKFFDKESLLVFLKPAEKMQREALVETATQSAAEELNRVKSDLQVLRQEHRELQSMLKRFDIFKIGLAGLIFLSFLLIIFYARQNLSVFPETQDTRTLETAEQRVVTAQMDTLEMDISFASTLEPHQKVTLAAQTSGTVVKRTFNRGDYVSNGQILYQMDTKDLAKSVRAARVKYMELLEQYNELKNWDKSLEVMQARRSYELSKIALENERKKLAETKKLFEKGIIPRVEYEEAVTQFKETQYDYENAKQTLEAKLEKGSEEKLQILRLKLSNAKEELDEVEAKYEATLIRAPVSGIIMPPQRDDGSEEPFKQEGDRVDEGDLVATIGATDSYILDAGVGELSVKYLRVGQKCEVTASSLGGIQLAGRLDWIASRAQVKSGIRTYPIRVVIADVPDSLRPRLRLGMLAQAAIPVRTFESVVTIPIEALVRDNGHPLVYVQDPETGEFFRHPVKTGYNDSHRIIIQEGLEPGDRVMINPPLG
jgi:PAS domain S-box-containing protein